MPYKTPTAWIFVLLMLIVVLLFMFPTPFVIGLGAVGLPVLILVQTLIVLFAKEESPHQFSDDRWYDQ